MYEYDYDYVPIQFVSTILDYLLFQTITRMLILYGYSTVDISLNHYLYLVSHCVTIVAYFSLLSKACLCVHISMINSRSSSTF